MKTLALEFSTSRRSVVAFAPSPFSGGMVLGASIQVSDTHTTVFGMIEKVLKQAGWAWKEVEHLAVSLGPGSYTGIRVAIALAQGWQLGRQCQISGIPVLDCYARETLQRGWTGRFHLVLDAQRQELYHALFEVDLKEVKILSPLRIASVEEVAKMLDRRDGVIGPEVQRWFSKGRILYPLAQTVARLALERRKFLPAEELEPIYLRAAEFIKAPAPRRFS